MSISRYLFSIAIAVLAASPARADDQLAFEPHAEVYTEHGEAKGCGLSFIAVWTQDKVHTVGVNGSANLFFDAEKKGIFSILKFTGVYDGTKLPVSYGWIETSVYGGTTSFAGQPGSGEDTGVFLAVKYSNPKTVLLPLQMAITGFTLGVAFTDQPLDNVVKLPPSDQATIQSIQDCMDALSKRMTAVAGQ